MEGRCDFAGFAGWLDDFLSRGRSPVLEAARDGVFYQVIGQLRENAMRYERRLVEGESVAYLRNEMKGLLRIILREPLGLRFDIRKSDAEHIAPLGAAFRAVILAAETFGCVNLGTMLPPLTAVLSLLEGQGERAMRALEEWMLADLEAAPANQDKNRLRYPENLTTAEQWGFLLLTALAPDLRFNRRCEKLAWRIGYPLPEFFSIIHDQERREELGTLRDLNKMAEVLRYMLEGKPLPPAMTRDIYERKDYRRRRPDLVFVHYFKKLEQLFFRSDTKDKEEIRSLVANFDEEIEAIPESEMTDREVARYTRKNQLLLALALIRSLQLRTGTSATVDSDPDHIRLKELIDELKKGIGDVHRSLQAFIQDLTMPECLRMEKESLGAALAATYEMHGRRDGLLEGLFWETPESNGPRPEAETSNGPHQTPETTNGPRQAPETTDGRPELKFPEFHIFRRWSSLTPLSPAGKQEYENVGGCYALRLGSAYLVIDPGFDTLYSLWRYSPIWLGDVQGILVSHGHPDHDAGLRELLCCMAIPGTGKAATPLTLWTPDSWCDLPGGDIATLRGSRVVESLRFDRAASPKGSEFRKKIGSAEVTVTLHPTAHQAIPKKKRQPIGMALRLQIGRWQIGITSDAAGDRDPQPLAEFFHDCDVIVCHVGFLKINETLPSARPDPQHLGLLGTTDLLRQLGSTVPGTSRCRLVVLSEFAALSGMLDWRPTFWQLLQRKLTGLDPRFPVMIGEIGSSILLGDDDLYVFAGFTRSPSGYVPMTAVDWERSYSGPLRSSSELLRLVVRPGWRMAAHPRWL